MKKFANLYLTLVFIILYIPIAYLIFYSFNQGGDMNGFTGFTLEHYSEMFADSRLMLILIQTFFFGVFEFHFSDSYWDIWRDFHLSSTPKTSAHHSFNE